MVTKKNPNNQLLCLFSQVMMMNSEAEAGE